jgi:hypothetical protein
MTFESLQTVVLTRDILVSGLRAGDIGTIVEVWNPTAYEVEFVDAAGKTLALLTLSNAAIRPIAETDMLTVRSKAAVAH